MGHFRNLDLSDHFLDIYHFYTKALLNKLQRVDLTKYFLVMREKDFFSIEIPIFRDINFN